jgi:hypothetical protein
LKDCKRNVYKEKENNEKTVSEHRKSREKILLPKGKTNINIYMNKNVIKCHLTLQVILIQSPIIG